MKENTQNEKIKSTLLEGLAKLYGAAEDHRGVSYEEYQRVTEEFYANMPNSAARMINQLDLQEFVAERRITVEATAERKGRVLMSQYPYQDEVGHIVDIINSDRLYCKQLAFGGIYEGRLQVWNSQPSTYCCGPMKAQFTYCDMHGLNCPDYFVKHRNGEFHVEANGYYFLQFCPFCGGKFSGARDSLRGIFVD